MTRCPICCTPATSATDPCAQCAAVTPAERDAAKAAGERVKEFGPSYTRAPSRYALAIAGAVKAAITKSKRKRRG